MNLPETYTGRMKKMLGEEYDAFVSSYDEPRLRGLRVNTLKITPDEFGKIAPFPLKKIPWIPNGFFYSDEVRPAGHPYYAAGLYYLQEPSAMTPASVLPVKPGDRVLDLCAAPGGKATELAARLGGRGLLVANDISNSRAKALLRNLERTGVTNMLVTNETPERLAGAFPGYFDCILADVPCSGEGMFRKDEAVAEVWSPARVRFFAAQQREILEQAYKMLRPGGLLLYSTCTFAPEEDEQQIAGFLERHPDISVTDTGLLSGEAFGGNTYGFAPGEARWLDIHTGSEAGSSGGREADEQEDSEQTAGGQTAGRPDTEASLASCVRIWPHRMRGEGHFLALMRKAEDAAFEYLSYAAERDRNVPGSGKKASRKKADRGQRGGKGGSPENPHGLSDEQMAGLIRPFLAGASGLHELQMETRGERSYMVQPLPDGVRGLRFLRNGLFLGEWKKGRFEPSQPLAMAQDPDAGAAEHAVPGIFLDADDVRASGFLRRETLLLTEAEAADLPDGWILVCAGRFPLGWGKKNGMTVKNRYPVSWP